MDLDCIHNSENITVVTRAIKKYQRREKFRRMKEVSRWSFIKIAKNTLLFLKCRTIFNAGVQHDKTRNAYMSRGTFLHSCSFCFWLLTFSICEILFKTKYCSFVWIKKNVLSCVEIKLNVFSYPANLF